jgi:hypothetical protein
MRTIFTPLLLLFAVAFHCEAQQSRTLSLKDGDEPLNLTPAFALADVIDLRADTFNIGLIKSGGALNNVEVASLKGGCAATLKRYIRQILPNTGGKTMLAMVIRDLRVSENVSFFRETARLHVKYEFYNLGDKDMPMVFSFARDFQLLGFDVTPRHEANIRRSVREALQELAAASAKGTLTAHR